MCLLSFTFPHKAIKGKTKFLFKKKIQIGEKEKESKYYENKFEPQKSTNLLTIKNLKHGL